MTTPADLPDSIEDLRALLLSQRRMLEEQAAQHEEEKQRLHAEYEEEQQQLRTEYQEEIQRLREYIRLLKSQHFGPRSERTPPDQLGLFNEAEAVCDAEGGDATSTIEVPSHTRRKRGGRRPLPDFLPREEVLHDLPEAEKVCKRPASGGLAHWQELSLGASGDRLRAGPRGAVTAAEPGQSAPSKAAA